MNLVIPVVLPRDDMARCLIKRRYKFAITSKAVLPFNETSLLKVEEERVLKESLEAHSTYQPCVFLEELRKSTKSQSKGTWNSNRSSYLSPTD